MPIVKFNLEKCVDNKQKIRCPFCTDKLTKGYGYAVDYMCSLMDNRVTSGYVEWDREINPVPDWCPILDHQANMIEIIKEADFND